MICAIEAARHAVGIQKVQIGAFPSTTAGNGAIMRKKDKRVC